MNKISTLLVTMCLPLYGSIAGAQPPTTAPAPTLAPTTTSAPATTPAPASAATSVPAVPRAAKATAQSEAGEPRADASPEAASPGAAPPAAPVASSAAAHGRPQGPHAPAANRASSADRLDLGTATVTGDREQPKVMYIVPWKKSEVGDPSGKPLNSLLDDVLAPVDRDEFKREVGYYDAMQANTPQNGASTTAVKQVEK